MLKMSAIGKGDASNQRLVVLGLSHRNLDGLRAGESIVVDATELGLPGVEILLFSGETEQSMARQVAEYIGPETKTKIDPRLRD